MKIELDPAGIEDVLKTWRDSADLKIPMLDEFKIAMMRNRRKVLENYLSIVSGWTVLFQYMQPADGHDQFAELGRKIDEFRHWVNGELEQLVELSRGE